MPIDTASTRKRVPLACEAAGSIFLGSIRRDGRDGRDVLPHDVLALAMNGGSGGIPAPVAVRFSSARRS